MDDKISGLLKKENRGYSIKVNSTHSINRKRFTIAHEIGHFMLHDDLIGDGISDNLAYRSFHEDHQDNNSKIQQEHETEANRFAAMLLMPEHLIKQEWQSGNRAISDLARKFMVSEQAMEIRLRGINLQS